MEDEHRVTFLNWHYEKIILHKVVSRYRKVVSSNTSHLEAYAGFFRLLMKEIFDPYVLLPFDKKLIS